MRLLKTEQKELMIFFSESDSTIYHVLLIYHLKMIDTLSTPRIFRSKFYFWPIYCYYDFFPVLVLHGILESSSDWVLASPKRSLGFMLADAGFDVWLGNMRGNTYGKRHCYKSPTNEDFWNFSVDHVGAYDIPAMIDRIRNITGQDKIFFIGFSMGKSFFRWNLF